MDVHSHAVALARRPSTQATEAVEALVPGRNWAVPATCRWTTNSPCAGPTGARVVSASSSACACIWGWRSSLSPAGSPGAMALSSAFTARMTSRSGGAGPAATGPTWRQSCLPSGRSTIPSIALPRGRGAPPGRSTAPTAAGACRRRPPGTARIDRGARAAAHAFGLSTLGATSASSASLYWWIRSWARVYERHNYDPLETTYVLPWGTLDKAVRLHDDEA